MITLPKRMSPSSATAISLSALALVGYIDFVTGELSLILLYFVPIGIEAWFVGRKASLVLSFLALGTWLSAYLTHEYNGATSACWDTAITLGIFISYSLLLSALRTARSRMEKIAKELARSNRDLQQFAYIASHDLQEPLRTAKGFLQLFEQRYGARLDLKALEYIHYAIEGTDRMGRLISDLLAYSRVNTQERRFEHVDCNAVLLDVLKRLQLAIRESDAQVRYDSLPTVRGASPLLIQLFQNLVGNALKFRDRQRPLTINIDAIQNGKEWKFAVRDNGIGIAPEHQERIFSIFHRLHRQEEYPGTGIGLAICKRIVEQHGGRIWVESHPGEGSAFLFTIPS